MENMNQRKNQLPHIVFLPLPAQGHIKPLLKLAELLSNYGFQVTFINNQQIHDRLLMSLDMSEFKRCHPEFEFFSIPNSAPPSRRHSFPGLGRLSDTLLALGAVIKQGVGQLLVSLNRKTGMRHPATCIIADGLLSSAVVDLADEFEIPYFAFRTSSASLIWSYFNFPRLIEKGDVPVLPEKDMDKLVTCIPGLENVRRRDLTGLFRIERADDPILESLIKDQTLVMPRASALILNTFHEIEGPVITQLASHFPKIYTLGPIHGFSSACNNGSTPSASSKSIFCNEDRSCITWLDSQLPKSVIYVSFGTVINLTCDQLFEFWHGLVNSGKSFLWVIRPESITGKEDANLLLGKLKDMTEDKGGLIVSWAPQEEVLDHPAIGGFLTHCGWNSTLEGLYAGLPMICWPGIGDQHTNSRFVSDVWKVGFDMKDSCDRLTIEKMIRDLMEDQREEIMKSVNELRKKARETVKVGGASFSNLEKLIGEIRSITHSAHT